MNSFYEELYKELSNENEIIDIVNSNPNYASYQKEINVSDFLKLLVELKKRLEVKDYFSTLLESDSFKDNTSGIEPSSFSIIKKRILKELCFLV